MDEDYSKIEKPFWDEEGLERDITISFWGGFSIGILIGICLTSLFFWFFWS